MDAQLKIQLELAFRAMAANNFVATPAARDLIETIIASLPDQGPLAFPNPRQVQEHVIENLPRYGELVGRKFQTHQITALMVLNSLPKFIIEYCPKPFEYPPEALSVE